MMTLGALGRSSGIPPWAGGVLVAVALVVSSLGVLPVAGAHSGSTMAGPPRPGSAPSAGGPFSLAGLRAAPLAAVEDPTANEPAAGAAPASALSGASVPVLLSLGFANSSALRTLLTEIGDPNSSQYHHYLSAAEFAARFSPNGTSYSALLTYLTAAGARSIVGYPDRLAVSFDATPAELRASFHAPVGRYSAQGSGYWAFQRPPELPRPLAHLVSSVVGLGPGSSSRAVPFVSVGGPSEGAQSPLVDPSAGASYPVPVTVNGTQFLYASDLQIGYDEEGLLDRYGAPTTSTVSALQWSGTYTANRTITACSKTLRQGQSVGPYDPSDLANYLSTALPTGEPAASIVPVALGGPAPGCLASYDSTGVVAANTAELEAIAAMAPGASVYALSTTDPSVVALTAELNAVLSPPTNLSAGVRDGLANVSAIAIGWGFADTNTTAWSSALAVAAARGITIAAATGNSADNPSSLAWVGSQAEFPASDATTTSGVLAVGGTSAELNAATLHLSREVAWNIPSSDVSAGGPLGTAGGISSVYVEPKFQKTTTANGVLHGAGRGVPDVAAVANNTLVTLTVNGHQYRATNASLGHGFLAAQGTGISVGIVVGLLAVIDHALLAAGDPRLGYLDPTVYTLGNEEYALPSGSGIQVKVTGAYDYGLPTTPFRDVKVGSNAAYSAGPGYDLVSGWGSVDAYNLTMYLLSVPTGGVYGDLNGVEDQVHFGPLHVTSTSSTGIVNSRYNASLQQNLFAANSLGAPVYWVQSILFAHRTSSGWAMNFTAWVSYPFFALYPTLTVYEYRFPASGDLEVLPITVTLTTTFVPAKGSTPAELKFSYGVPGVVILTLNVPGAAYIIGSSNYTYAWQGTTYTNGPEGAADPIAFLAPQTVLVGAPTGGIGRFGAGTKGSMTALVEPSGSATFVAAHVGLVNASNTQSTESAVGLAYTPAGANAYDFAYAAGATTDGIFQSQPLWFPVRFAQTGVPSTATWFVNFSSGVSYAAPGTAGWINLSLPNGTYSWSASTSVLNWSSVPSSGSFTVGGKPTKLTLTFGPAAGTVTFQARGPVKAGRLPFAWYINITGQPSYVGTAYMYNASLPYGSYPYKIASSNKSYTPGKGAGSVTVSRAPQTIYVVFSLKTYLIEFVFQLPKSPPGITISMAGYAQSGSFATWGLDEPNGTYHWSITDIPLGYAVHPSGGTVVVHGPVTPITVVITEPGWGPFGLGVLGYGLVVGAPALLALWLGVRRYRRRRAQRSERAERPPSRRPPPPPPSKSRPPERKPRGSSRYLRPDDL